MILTSSAILKEIKKGNIQINPFVAGNITTNSYDLSIGEKLLFYTDKILDPKKNNKFKILKIPQKGLLLKKGTFCLASSLEIVGSDKFVPIIHAKSGIARLGMFVHITADLVDIGYHGNVTFQLYTTLPIKIYPNMKIAQVTFWVPDGKIKLYSGKYQNSSGPQASKYFKNI